MKLELLIFIITGLVIYNFYYDGKFLKKIMAYKKYIQIGGIIFVAFIFYYMLKKDPQRSKKMLLYANNFVHFLPISKSSIDMISPILDFTNINNGSESDFNQSSSFMGGLNSNVGTNGINQPVLNMNITTQNQYEKKILSSGGKATKRSVSETKKKYVASQQGWKCENCKNQLNAWFEVDHKTRLEYGGGNNVENLVALCRECHGRKTAMENM
jgi:hypothetical protein